MDDAGDDGDYGEVFQNKVVAVDALGIDWDHDVEEGPSPRGSGRVGSEDYDGTRNMLRCSEREERCDVHETEGVEQQVVLS